MKYAPLWTVADCRPSNVDKKSVEGQAHLRLCNYTDVYNNHYIDADMELMEATAPADQIERFQLQVGDVIITKDSESNKDIGIPSLVRTSAPGIVCGYHLTLLRPETRALESRYLYWWLESQPVKDFWYTNSFGVTRYSLVSPTVWRLPVRLPELADQHRIADYLDRETTEIDAMDDELDRLVQMLVERRANVVLSRVRRDADVKSPSLQLVASLVAGAGFPTDEQGREDLEVPFYKVNALGRADADGVIRFRDHSITRDTATRLRADIIPAGASVMAKIGAALMLGRIRQLGLAGCIDNNMLAVLPGSKVEPRYLFWALHALDMNEIVNPSTIPFLNERALRGFQVPLPSLNQQRHIAIELDEQTAQIDGMIADAQRLKALLAERRSTLITEVVTGRKKVPAA